MKSQRIIIPGALFLVCSIAGGLAYVNRDALESALAAATTHVHGTRGTATPGGGDPLGCHRHDALTYHCH